MDKHSAHIAASPALRQYADQCGFVALLTFGVDDEGQIFCGQLQRKLLPQGQAYLDKFVACLREAVEASPDFHILFNAADPTA